MTINVCLGFQALIGSQVRFWMRSYEHEHDQSGLGAWYCNMGHGSFLNGRSLPFLKLQIAWVPSGSSSMLAIRLTTSPLATSVSSLYSAPIFQSRSDLFSRNFERLVDAHEHRHAQQELRKYSTSIAGSLSLTGDCVNLSNQPCAVHLEKCCRGKHDLSIWATLYFILTGLVPCLQYF